VGLGLASHYSIGSIFSSSFYFAKKPQTIPPIRPSPRIGGYCLVINASGRLKTKPTNPPLTQPGIGSSMLKMMNPIANLLMNEAAMALVLSSKVIKNIGIIETIPKIVPAMKPFKILLIFYFLSW